MKNFNVQALMKWLDARQLRERIVLLGAALAIIVMIWLALVHDVLVAARQDAERNITIAVGGIAAEQARQAEIRSTYNADPNGFALARQRELREATEHAATRLDELYGELVSPEQMSLMLTSILQNETTLKLVSLNNVDSELVVTAESLPDDAVGQPLQVFKHGLRMVFRGSFLETVYYLRSLEKLDGNFFWENLQFDLGTYPEAQISLDIYTLSTEQGFIGV